MTKTQAIVTGAVVVLWLTLHVARAVAGLCFGIAWDVDPAVNYAMGSVITLTLGGPAVYQALRRNGRNGKGKSEKEKANGAG